MKISEILNEEAARYRHYVGCKGTARFTFKAANLEMAEHYAKQSGAGAVIGPFKTKQGADFMAKQGASNPHCATVADAERLAKHSWNKINESSKSIPSWMSQNMYDHILTMNTANTETKGALYTKAMKFCKTVLKRPLFPDELRNLKTLVKINEASESENLTVDIVIGYDDHCSMYRFPLKHVKGLRQLKTSDSVNDFIIDKGKFIPFKKDPCDKGDLFLDINDDGDVKEFMLQLAQFINENNI